MTAATDEDRGRAPTFDLDAVRREGLARRPRRRGPGPRRHRPGRPGLHRRGQGGAADRSARCGCRPGVTVFDSASWNGIAIDSTCGGHGTCHKCKVRLDPGRPRSPGTTCRRSAASSSTTAGGWPAWPGRPATSRSSYPPLTTRPKAATVGVGRQVILRPAVQKRYVELAEPTLADQRDRPRPAARRDRRPRAARRPARAAAAARRCCGEADFKVTAVVVDEDADRRRARRHHRRCGTRSPSTSAPPRWWRPCSTSSPAPRSRWPRCSTSSSPSAAT